MLINDSDNNKILNVKLLNNNNNNNNNSIKNIPIMCIANQNNSYENSLRKNSNNLNNFKFVFNNIKEELLNNVIFINNYYYN